MSLVDQLLGRTPVREDSSVVPVVAGRRPQAPDSSRRKPPEDEEDEDLRHKAARHRSVVASIMGMAESDEEGIIPADAKRVDTLTGGEQIPGIRSDPLPKPERPAEPARTTNNSGEELIEPSAALVAPDITPNVRVPIDPSAVPMAPQRLAPPPSVAAAQQDGARDVWNSTAHVMDMILGRQSAAPQPVNQANLEMQAESVVASMADSVDIKTKAAMALMPESQGAAMPIHQEGDGRSVFNAARRFMR
jgi:hypothetical protein